MYDMYIILYVVYYIIVYYSIIHMSYNHSIPSIDNTYYYLNSYT